MRGLALLGITLPKTNATVTLAITAERILKTIRKRSASTIAPRSPSFDDTHSLSKQVIRHINRLFTDKVTNMVTSHIPTTTLFL